MRRTGYVYALRYLLHDPGSWHPERPDRLKAIHDALEDSGLLELLVRLRPDYAPLAWVERLHDPDYIRRFKEACEQGRQIIDTQDCGISKQSYETALLAVGGVLLAVDAVMKGEVDNAFCAVRPPGHHAERDRAMGFCFFNNVALGAVYALENYGLERVAIVDWDVHHGNGTQHLFEADPRVFYVSLHEDPQYCYPGTGYRREEGKGPGQGFNLNSALPAPQRRRRIPGGPKYRGLAAPAAICPAIGVHFGGFRRPHQRPAGAYEPDPVRLPGNGTPGAGPGPGDRRGPADHGAGRGL